MKKQIVLIGGIAGSGKSTIASYISQGYPYVYIDKDNVTSELMEALLLSIKKSRHDRESKEYIEKVRPYEYKQFLDTVFHISEHNYIIGAAPFLKEFQDEEWLMELKRKVEKQEDELILIWVNTNPKETKERLILRDEQRDYYKIEHFDEYTSNIIGVNKKIILNLNSMMRDKKIKTYIINNFNGTLEDTFDKIDTIIYKINDL